VKINSSLIFKKMKKNEDSPKYVQNVIKRDPLLRKTDFDFSSKVGKSLKRFIYVSSLVGMGLFFNSCIGGYIDSEPAYVQVERPPQPSNLHIWIDGDWVYNHQTRAYAQNAGYWQKPIKGRTFVSGHWQASAKGRYWAKGKWQRTK
jgi:hypothetical protein